MNLKIYILKSIRISFVIGGENGRNSGSGKEISVVRFVQI